MSRTLVWSALVLGVSLTAALWVWAEDPPAEPKPCPAVWYQSTACGQPALYCEDSCTCDNCTKDGTCPCLKELTKGAGTIKGTVQSKYLKRGPIVVSLEDTGKHEFRPAPRVPLMDQKDKVFLPKFLPVLKGTTVRFANSDSFDHNVFSPDGERFDLGNFGKGKAAEYTFDKKGVYSILCKLHPEMLAYVISVETPFFAVVEGVDQAAFTLRHVPAGKWRVRAWHERFRGSKLDYAVEVTVAEGQTAEVTLKP